MRHSTTKPHSKSQTSRVYKVAYLDVPDVHALVKGAAGQEFAVGTERYAVDGFLVFSERVHTLASLRLPQTYGRVKRSAGQDKVGIGVVTTRACGTPFNGVNLFAVSLEVMNTLVVLHAPDLESHVIGARRQQLTLRVPLDGVNFILHHTKVKSL